MIFIDSDILIWILRNNEEYKSIYSEAVKEYDGAIFISPIQFAEIVAGIREKEKLDTELFLDSLRIIDINKEIGKLAGEYMKIHNKSHNIHTTDAIIAAIAKINNLKLWTCNKKHYPMLNQGEFYKA